MEHSEWLKWRLNGIGSSDSAVIMGVSPWKSLRQLYMEKAFGLVEETDNPWMARGRELEPIVRAYIEERDGLLLSPENIENKEHEYIRCSVDAIDFEHKILYEIKCPGRKDHEIAMDGNIPDKYYPQCQHQLLVTNLSSMWYVSFYDQDYIFIKVERDEKYIEEMKKLHNSFWTKVLESRNILNQMETKVLAKK